MSFTIIATISSIAGAVLGIGWLFGGKLLFSRWGIDSHFGGLILVSSAFEVLLVAGFMSVLLVA